MSEYVGWMRFDAPENLLSFLHDNGAEVVSENGEPNKIHCKLYPGYVDDLNVANEFADFYADFFDRLGAPAINIGRSIINVSMSMEMLPHTDLLEV